MQSIKYLTPSKELVSEVLDIRAHTVSRNEEYIQYEYNHDSIRYTDNDINNDSFANLCKKWAFEQGITMVSSGYFINYSDPKKNVSCKIKKLINVTVVLEEEFVDTSEIDAIIQMGEFVLKNLKTIKDK